MSNSEAARLGEIAQKLIHDCLHSIIHESVLHRHREHKLLINSLDATTRLPHCANCHLPRLLDPPLAPKVRGTTSDPPKDTTYCDRKPWSRRPGFDIYDNPFPKSDVTGRPPTKKEREEAKRKKEAGGDGTQGDEAHANGTSPPSPSAEGEGGTNKGEKLEKGEKKANKIDEKLKKGEYVPWQTCPSCKRSLLITRFAKHLEQCMGLSGRAASRNAMAKMNGSTPNGSRGGTPNPSQDGLRADDDDDDDVAVKNSGGVRKKLLKKGLTNKIKKDKTAGQGNGQKIPKSLTAAKRPPGSSNNNASPVPSSAAGGEKRDRDDGEDNEDDNVHVKKRQKLQRVGSVASVGSASTVAPLSAVDVDPADSNDESFVDDGSTVDE